MRTKDRIKTAGEVFTPPILVEAMLDRLPESAWEIDRSFLDPACGTGNFLAAVFSRKAKRGHAPLNALKNIFGADIMRDNVIDCRLRLLKLVSVIQAVTEEHVKAVLANIAWIDQQKYPNGSLEYDFSFLPSFSESDVTQWMSWASIPVQDLPVTSVELRAEECF